MKAIHIKSCDWKLSCIFIIVDDKGKLTAVANSTKFKLVQKIFICNISAAILSALGGEVEGF